MLVIDASAMTELLLGRRPADTVERQVAEHAYDLHAPHLLDVEVLSALRRVVAAGDATPLRAEDAIEDLLDLPLERYPHDILVPRVWELRGNFSAYDAAYVALAEALAEGGATLLTSDALFAKATRRHTGIHVVLAG
jgi:predicted nucleic acid-binding protein